MSKTRGSSTTTIVLVIIGLLLGIMATSTFAQTISNGPVCGSDLTVTWTTPGTVQEGFLTISNDEDAVIAIIIIDDLTTETVTFTWSFPGVNANIALFSGVYGVGTPVAIGTEQTTAIATTDRCIIVPQCLLNGNGATNYGDCDTIFPTTAQVAAQLTTPVVTAPWDLVDVVIDLVDITCAPIDVKVKAKTTRCGVSLTTDGTTPNGTYLAEAYETHSGSIPLSLVCDVDNVSVKAYRTTQCTQSCTTCEAAATCASTFGAVGTDFNLDDAACTQDCECVATTLTLAVGSPTDITCGDEIILKWEYPDYLDQTGVDKIKFVDFTTGAQTTTLFTTDDIDLADKTFTQQISFAAGAGVTKIVAVWVSGTAAPTAAMTFVANGQCRAPTLICSTTAIVKPTDGTIPQCIVPTEEQIIANEPNTSAWTTSTNPIVLADLVCDDEIVFTAPAFTACAIANIGGTYSEIIPSSNCTPLEPTVTYTMTCQAQCSSTLCGVGCSATLGTEIFGGFNQCDSFTGTLATNCGCTATFTGAIPPVNCQDTVTLAWTKTNPNTPLAVDTIELWNDATLLNTFTGVAFNSGTYQFIFGEAVPAGTVITVKFKYADGDRELTTGANTCVARNRCVSVDRPTIAVPCVDIVSEVCNVCNPTFTVPATNYACFTGSTKEDTLECTGLDIPTVECTCELACGIDAANENAPILCTDAWTISEDCGTPDSLDISKAFLATLAGTQVSCAGQTATGQRCYIESTQRITADNIGLCTGVSAECSPTEDTPTWGECAADFDDCPTTPNPLTCGPTQTRYVSCAIPIANNAEFNVEFDTTIDATVVAELFGVDVDIIDTNDSAIMAKITALNGSCTDVTTTTLVPQTNQCECTPSLYCFTDLTETDVTVAELEGDAPAMAVCQNNQANFNCPLRCTNAGITGTVEVDRTVYCRAADGSFTLAAAGDDCDEAVTTFDCAAITPCSAALYCGLFTSDGTTPVANADALTIADPVVFGGDDDVAPCGVENFFGATCFAPTDTTLFPYAPEVCTFAITDPLVSLRRAQCKVFVTAAPNAQIAVAADYGNLCESLTPVFSQSGCSDWTGCTPSIEDVIIDDDVNIDQLTIDLNDDATTATQSINFEFTYVGPLNKVPETPYQVSIQFTQKIGDDMTPETSNIWTNIATIPTIRNSLDYDWTFENTDPVFDFAITGTLVDEITVFIRIFVSNKTPLDSTDYSYPLTLTVKRNLSCAANPTLYTGVNVICQDNSNGVAQLACADGTTPDNTLPTGPCSRTATCNAKTPVCQNSGFYMANPEQSDDCDAECTCSGGFSAADSCTTCIPCDVGRGVLRTTPDTTCGCSECRQGFKNGPGGNDLICSDCDIYALIKIENPSVTLTTAVSSTATESQIAQFNIFANHLRALIASALNFPIKPITITRTKSIVTPTSVALVIDFTGNCIALAKRNSQQSFLVELATTGSADLTIVADNFTTQVNQDSLSQDSSFSSYALAPNSAIDITTSFAAPSLFVPETPPPPGPEDKKKKKTNVVAIVVPIVVCVVVIIVIAIIVWVIFFREPSNNESSREKKQKSSEDAPAPKSKHTREQDDGGHLELI